VGRTVVRPSRWFVATLRGVLDKVDLKALAALK
jgi:hypothetical protein